MATPADPPSQRPTRRVLALVATLVIVGVLATVLLTQVADFTRARIARNEQAWIQQHLDALVPPPSHDNDLLSDAIGVISPDLLGTSQPVTIYRARRHGMAVAAVIRSVAPDGYRGPLELLVAIAYDGTLLGVHVLRHNETPGLGDAFEKRQPHWLERFRGRSLSDPPQQRWTVRKDGGDFDAFTGATITPRAIVREVRRTLEYYQANRDRIFTNPAVPAS
jgi:H+/Na+-translocating ferredoxin:NAD+ oxidoreductase subunit G